MARPFDVPPQTPVPRADDLPDEAQVPLDNFVPPDDAAGDLPMIPFENFADKVPEETEELLEGLFDVF